MLSKVAMLVGRTYTDACVDILKSPKQELDVAVRDYPQTDQIPDQSKKRE